MAKIKVIDLESLKDMDLYSLSMFLLYKLKNVPKFSTLSELPYLLDRDNLLKLCKYLGGQTIRIPTIEELNNMMRTLLLYQYHVIEGREWKLSLQLVGYNSSEYRNAKKNFNMLMTVLKDYNIDVREIYE